MNRIKVTHFLQDPAHCAVAASAVVANYYNPEVGYEDVKKIAYKKVSKKIPDIGLDSAEICLLLNHIGFNKVTIITSYFGVWDYSWEGYGKRKLIEVLNYSASKKKDRDDKGLTKNFIKWLNLKNDNKVKINYDFGKHIRKTLNKNMPVILTFNWTMFQKYCKDGEEDNILDPINGSFTEHAVVANGYDDKGVWIVDSHHQFYKYKRKKYRKGFYKMSWENLMTCMGQGDVILPDDYYVE